MLLTGRVLAGITGAALVFAIAVFSVPGVAFAGASGRVEAQASDVKSKAINALNAKDYDAAIRLLEQASANDQFDEELKKLLGIAYTERGWAEAGGAQFKDALSDFNKARLTEPQKQQATYLGLGYVSFRMTTRPTTLARRSTSTRTSRWRTS